LGLTGHWERGWPALRSSDRYQVITRQGRFPEPPTIVSKPEGKHYAVREDLSRHCQQPASDGQMVERQLSEQTLSDNRVLQPLPEMPNNYGEPTAFMVIRRTGLPLAAPN